MKKINFSGGEPLLKPKYLGELIRYAKEDLYVDSVSIVSNGSLIKRKWMEKYGKLLDIIAISCDSFNCETNKKIGRTDGKKGNDHLTSVHQVRKWCYEFDVAFKINTVVNVHNVEEDMTDNILELNPVRWKVFQCLLIDGENAGPDSLRRAEEMVISLDQFEGFCTRHSRVKDILVPENNDTMRDSYLILDEHMRFLDNTSGSKKPSRSILKVGVESAMNNSGYDEEMFYKRGGRYKWSKEEILPHNDW